MDNLTGRTFESNNFFSDTITIQVLKQLSDGSYLVHKHTDCCEKYRDEHPDAFYVVTSEMLTNRDLDFVTTTIGQSIGGGEQ